MKYNLYTKLNYKVYSLYCLYKLIIVYKLVKLGIGDWGLGNPQSPIPNPHLSSFIIINFIT